MFCAWSLVAPLRTRRLPAVSRRLCCSKQAAQHNRTPKRSTFRPAPSSIYDWIGPPNPLSNLRPIVYHVPENETELEKRLRRLRQETEDWNHDFWTKQNITFSKMSWSGASVVQLTSDLPAETELHVGERDAFIISRLNAKGLTVRDEKGRRRSLNSEEMAVFYKSFLDNNRIRHANYNNEWYRRNFTITLLMARVGLNNMWKAVTGGHSSKKDSTPTD